jgi:hypothetical protein
MSELEFKIDAWLGALIEDPLEKETLSSFRILVGPDRVPATEVDDLIAHTVRGHINVPAYRVARWLIVNWWRLRWEPYRKTPSLDWLNSHSMASLGGDYAWPALTFSSDGEFIQLRLRAEVSPDVSAVRYLRDIRTDIPAADFERAVDGFLGTVEQRLVTRLPHERELIELREELNSERSDSRQKMDCKLQALAGIDPGASSMEWMKAVRELARQTGAGAIEEVVAATSIPSGGLGAAQDAISAMHESKTTVKLDWAVPGQVKSPANEVPWKRGEHLARKFRETLGIPSGPIENNTLEELLDVKLPLPRSLSANHLGRRER